MISSSRTKACDIDFQRQKYIRHLHRLIKLKNGVSSEQIKKNEDEKRLAETIQKMRKIHEYSRSYRWRQNKEVEDQQTQQKRCKKIKSIIKQEIDRPILNIVSRNQKRNELEIFRNNVKIFQKITQMKPNLNRNLNITQGKQLFRSQNDFSQIYGLSKIFEKNRKIIKVDMSKGNKNVMKLKIEINQGILNQQQKDRNEFYFLEFQIGKNKNRSSFFQINNIDNTDILLKIPKNCFENYPITAKLFKILQNSAGEKEIMRESFRIQPLQMRSELGDEKEEQGQLELKQKENQKGKEKVKEKEKEKEEKKEEDPQKQKENKDEKDKQFPQVKQNLKQVDQKGQEEKCDQKSQKKIKKVNKILRYEMKINTQRMPIIYKQRIVSQVKMNKSIDKNKMIR